MAAMQHAWCQTLSQQHSPACPDFFKGHAVRVFWGLLIPTGILYGMCDEPSKCIVKQETCLLKEHFCLIFSVICMDILQASGKWRRALGGICADVSLNLAGSICRTETTEYHQPEIAHYCAVCLWDLMGLKVLQETSDSISDPEDGGSV